jgi:hypothetical protein
MKECMKCGESKPFSEFYKHKAMKDGFLNKCKSCARKDAIDNRNSKIDYYREYDRSRPRRGSVEATKRYRDENPVKYHAHSLINNLVRTRKIIKPSSCESCGSSTGVEGHHDDYAKPLEVRWLCSVCHKKWHKENGEGLNP